MKEGKIPVRLLFTVSVVLILALISSCALVQPTATPVLPSPEPELSELGEFEELRKGFEAIDSQEISEGIQFLASDRCQGRLVGTEGNRLAGEFLVKKLKEYDLKPMGEDFYQRFLLEKKTLIPEKTNLRLFDQKEEIVKDYRLKIDFYPTWKAASATVRGSVIFAGYGITAPEFNYDDYAKINVKGKIVMVMWGEPKENEDTPIFDGRFPTRHSYLEKKIENAKKHGAVGLIIPVYKPPVFERPVYDLEGKIEIPSIFAGQDLAWKFLEDTNYHRYQEIRVEIDKTLEPVVFEITAKILEFSTIFEIEKIEGRNVVGELKGQDKNQEYLVISAHYDHLGVMESIVHPGADDNASGTIAILEMAEAFGILAKNGIWPKRSIIFCFFDSEEWGRYGSRYFVENSPVPFEKIVTVINLDMIGRNDPQSLEVIGCLIPQNFPERNPDLYQALTKANQLVKLEFVYPEGYLESHQDYQFNLSDQASFLYQSPKENRLPVVSLSSGLHEDYHQPTDTADKIDNQKVENIAKLLFLTAWQISNLKEKPDYKEEVIKNGVR